ncbi:MAG TPA: CoA-binding protein [Acidobacteriaceae bacterium]|nr:CoA-binding protein [Acidobacteriaceae bacterium]
MNEPDMIDEIFTKTKTIAVVGISDKANRASYGVSAQMQRLGYRIVPVNPTLQQVLGEKCYPSLREIPFPVDLVNVFRAPEFVPGIIEDAIAIGARYIWLQEGVTHPEASARAIAASLRLVADKCLYKEHLRWQAEHRGD